MPARPSARIRWVTSRHLADAGLPAPTIAARYPQEWAAFWKRHYLDYDHFTSAGHDLAAEALFPLLEEIAGGR